MEHILSSSRKERLLSNLFCMRWENPPYWSMLWDVTIIYFQSRLCPFGTEETFLFCVFPVKMSWSLWNFCAVPAKFMGSKWTDICISWKQQCTAYYSTDWGFGLHQGYRCTCFRPLVSIFILGMIVMVQVASLFLEKGKGKGSNVLQPEITTGGLKWMQGWQAIANCNTAMHRSLSV